MNVKPWRNLFCGLSLVALAACNWNDGGGEAVLSGAAGSGTSTGSTATGSTSTSSTSTSTSSGSAQSTSTGTAVVALTDAAGDFLHYIVTVTSIQLKKADGTLVETLPASAQVDFAQLVNLSEVISAATVPAGTYTAATISLDYSAASLIIDNGVGGSIAVPTSNILNGTATGSPPVGSTVMKLELVLPAGKPLIVSKDKASHLAIDFGLAVSNTILPAPSSLSASTTPAEVTVTLGPAVAASVVPDAGKSMNLRGGFVSANASASTYTVHVRPFYKRTGRYGDIAVKTTSKTVFQINGVTTTGSAGLTALAAVAADTAVLATGSFDPASQTFTAATVYVGAGSSASASDGVEGVVAARSGNLLTLTSGVVVERAKDVASVSKSVAVTVGSATKVTKSGVAGSFDIADISVGQRVEISGVASADAAGNRSLDAKGGAVRLLPTSLWGNHVSTAGNVVTVKLQAIEGRLASTFNFAGTGTGTGTSTTNDAVASAYTVAVPQSLSTAGLVAGNAVRFTGFVSRFGAAPPAFTAVSLANYAATEAKVDMEFPEPSGNTAPFVFSSGKLQVTSATLQASKHAHLDVGPVQSNIRIHPLTNGLTLQPDASASSVGYVIAHRTTRKSESYASFADFAAALQKALPGGTSLTGLLDLGGDGAYDATTATLSVRHLFIVLND